MASVATTTMPLDREFARIYAQHFRFVWRMVSRRGVAPGDVDDVVQDVFMVVYRRLPDFEHRSRVTTWLVGIIRRVVWRHCRGRQRARRKHDGLRVVAPTSDPFSVQRSAAADRLERFISELPRAQREIFVLSELEGLRGPEIARATGTKLNTVYARIRSSRGRFERWCEGEVGSTPRCVRQQAMAAAEPPEGAQPRIWGLLVVKLGVTSAVVGASTLATSLKTFAVVLGIGGLGAIAARASIDAPDPSPAVSVASAVEDRSHPRLRRPSTSPSVLEPPQADPPSPPRSGPPQRALAVPPPPRQAEPRAEPESSPPAELESSPAPAGPAASGLAQERQLIAAARARLATAPREALAALEEHARRFESGMLAPERIRLTVRSWCSLDHDQARRVAHGVSAPDDLLARECPEAALPTPAAPSAPVRHDDPRSSDPHR